MNTIRIWFIGSRSDLIWSIFRWLRSSIVTWFSNHLESPLIIKVIPVLIQPNKKNKSASEFIRNFKTIQSHFSKNSLCRAWSRGSILIWSLFWMIWVWPEIKVCLVSTPTEIRLWPLILGMECHYLPGCSWTLLQVSNLECSM